MGGGGEGGLLSLGRYETQTPPSLSLPLSLSVPLSLSMSPSLPTSSLIVIERSCWTGLKSLRAQKLCESRGGRPGLAVPNYIESVRSPWT